MNTNSPILSALNNPRIIRLRHWRLLKDKIARYVMTVGGVSVIIAIILIFFYLLYVVLPLLLPASLRASHSFQMPAPAAGTTLHLALEEKNAVGVRFTDQAHAVFFNAQDGTVIADSALPLPAAATITSFAVADPATQVIAYGLSNGQVLAVQHAYNISYPEGVRTIKPYLKYPFGEEALTIDEQGTPLRQLAVQIGEQANTIVAMTEDNRLILVTVTKETNFLSGATTLNRTRGILPLDQLKITHLLLDKEQRLIYLADSDGQIWRITVNNFFNKMATPIANPVRVVQNQKITALTFLTGDISLLIGDSSGKIAQWFPVRGELTFIREFRLRTTPIIHITPEERRKGFVAVDEEGYVGIFHTTAERTLLQKHLNPIAFREVTLSPRADSFLAENAQGQLQVWTIRNAHPEISWSALWSKVWYESYPEPQYIWQSSAASNDFEPKFSLTPLAFGTFKAAFYAMLLAVPLAVLGAIYTAYFMAPGMRKLVKPTIEIMAALPTVILGFLAGLWLAPTIETNLLGVFLLFLLVPISVLVFAYAWNFLPKTLAYRIPDGWQAAILIPVILAVGWFSFAISSPLEALLFKGNIVHWLTTEWGIGFDQRNALIVGIAMGLAVIPNIFSISEDAVFSVPKHLTVGSLALGATPWQTMTRVVILTASPGIFSAVMIGMGRAVGETMIVLMATGNTPVMDFSLFQGLRTLSANIAVEMPESEVNSTHFRVLFLAGLVLFIFTFFFNTLAEVVRQRLRRKYSSL